MTDDNLRKPDGRLFDPYPRHTFECQNCGTWISWKSASLPRRCPYCGEKHTFRRHYLGQ